MGDDPLVISLGQLNSASSLSYDELLKRHTDDYTSLFNKVSLKLSDRRTDTIPTDRRLRNQKDNPDDLRLAGDIFPVRKIPADLFFPGRLVACKSAGYLGQQDPDSLEL